MRSSGTPTTRHADQQAACAVEQPRHIWPCLPWRADEGPHGPNVGLGARTFDGRAAVVKLGMVPGLPGHESRTCKSGLESDGSGYWFPPTIWAKHAE
jgi:hypothetical protein